MTETIHLDISQNILAALKIGVNDFAKYVRLVTAIACFQDKKLSPGKAAQLAGYNRLVQRFVKKYTPFVVSVSNHKHPSTRSGRAEKILYNYFRNAVLDFLDLLAEKGITVFDYDDSFVESELHGVAHLATFTE